MFLQKTGYLKTLREPNKNGISVYEGKLILIITNSKYLESIEFHNDQLVLLCKIFQEIAEIENKSTKGDVG